MGEEKAMKSLYEERIMHTKPANPLHVSALAMLLGACGFNPTEGDFGPVEVVPEVDSCRVKVRPSPGVVRYEWQPCDGPGHDVKFFGRGW